MKTVKISELKAHLSDHLQMVSSGEEVVVCDGNRPIARIVPIYTSEYTEREMRLIAKGVLRPAAKRAGVLKHVPNPAPGPPIAKEIWDALWDEERADRT